jgi:uncharacterized protein
VSKAYDWSLLKNTTEPVETLEAEVGSVEVLVVGTGDDLRVTGLKLVG